MGPQKFATVQKNGRSRNFSAGGTNDFINFCYDSMKFYL